MRVLFILIAFCLAGTVQAASCPELRTISRDEARQLMSALSAPEADPLDQLFAFEDLMCADQPVIRMMALRNGSTAESDGVRSQILLRALMEKRVLRIDLGEGTPIRAKDANYVVPMPVLQLDVLFRDPQGGCLSFHQTSAYQGCHPSSLAQVFGTTLTIKVDWGNLEFSGEFDYEYGQTITGSIEMNRGIYPAAIQLF